MKIMEQPNFIYGSKTKPAMVKKLSKYRVLITLTEGKNRQVRRLCEQAGYKVKKLKRIRILNLTLDDLPKGRIKQLKKADINKLYAALGIDKDRMWLTSKD